MTTDDDLARSSRQAQEPATTGFPPPPSPKLGASFKFTARTGREAHSYGLPA